ncbi:MAG: hypothetical protein V4696_00455 [Pseudomonadota bacterium]
MANKLWLLLATSVAFGGAGLAQVVPESASGLTVPEPDVEGATPDRVATIAECQGHKFDTMVQIDPARNRSTRVKLCAEPGASDSDWVKTLEAAIEQIEARDMPVAAKDKVIAELRQEMAKFEALSKPAAASPSTTAFAGNLGDLGSLDGPPERFETSIVPPLPPPLPRKSAAATASGGAAVAALPPTPAMRFRIKCLTRGERGSGGTCDFFESGTSLALSAVEGLEKGATLRFRRKGEARADVAIAPLAAGRTVRVSLPNALCRGVAFTRIELELLPPGSTGPVAARAGPYEMRC